MEESSGAVAMSLPFGDFNSWFLCRYAVAIAHSQQQILVHQIVEAIAFGCVLILGLNLARRLRSERQLQQQLAIADHDLDQCVAKLETLTAVQERNRSAWRVHDALGHRLAALNIQLQTAIALSQLDPAQAQSSLSEAQQQGRLAMQEVRQSVRLLRADVQGDASIEATITALVEQCQYPGVLTSIRVRQGALLPPQIALIFNRIVQEVLTAPARQQAVQVQINVAPDLVCLTIQEAGSAMKVQSRSGREIQQIRDRLTELKGQLQITTEPGSGCRFMVELPQPEASVQ